MHFYDQMFAALEATPFATAVRESTWMFPTFETLHVLFIALVVGTIMIVDFRLINVASRHRPVSVIMREVLPWTWGAFAGALIFGGLLFCSAATKYAHNPQFLFKMLLLLLAAANMAVFHLGSGRKIELWDQASMTPNGARIAGGLSMVIWVSVIVLGRWIGFATN